MKKEFLLFTVIVLLVFIAGLLIGMQLNDNRRYQMKDYNNGFLIFDTKTGVYFYRETYNSIDTYHKGDLQNAIREEYKSKEKSK